jgi:hypothetical protein
MAIILNPALNLPSFATPNNQPEEPAKTSRLEWRLPRNTHQAGNLMFRRTTCLVCNPLLNRAVASAIIAICSDSPLRQEDEMAQRRLPDNSVGHGVMTADDFGQAIENNLGVIATPGQGDEHH